MAEVSKVWIEEGCISCNLCMDITPEVFLVEDGQDCSIKADAAQWFKMRQEEIILAADDCPVEVIKWE